MNYFLSLGILILMLTAGLVVGKFIPGSGKKIVSRTLTTTLLLLLFFMGFRLSTNPNITSQFALIGAQAFVFAFFAISGTAFVLILFYLTSLLRKDNSSSPGKDENSQPLNPGRSIIMALKESGTLALFVLIGALVGKLPFWPESFTGEQISSYVLYFLLFVVGVQLEKDEIKIFKAAFRREVVLIPLGTVTGTLLGGIIGALILKINIYSGMAVVSGLGWYSLSGIILADLGNPVLGATAFLSNIFRESLAILLIPLLARLTFPRIGIGLAGATSMDVTLPMISKACGSKDVPLSITNGSILSILVPILVPLFYSAL